MRRWAPLLALLLVGPSSSPRPGHGLSVRMICGDRYNLAPPPSHSLLMMRSSSREGRIETVEAYSDREVRFSIQERDRPFLACAARTTPERLSRFIAQLT